MASGSQKSQPVKFQAPKGTRDFYPDQMAVRRYIEGVWRKTSINHGFDEVEGPMFEHLDLYTHKSGPGIVSEIFQVFSGKDEEELAKIRGGAAAPYALRPEFTPTLARMVASKAAELPRPIKWFAIPQHFRAERPQRGRLREFVQWNVDFIGEESQRADAEVIATAIRALERLGLESKGITVKISNRDVIDDALRSAGVQTENIAAAMELLDKVEKLDRAEVQRRSQNMGLDITRFKDAIALKQTSANEAIAALEQARPLSVANGSLIDNQVISLISELGASGIVHWCEVDFSIVRGLAYYTGTVFEIIAEGERAVAGGGRYDKLIESFGGPSLPACGFGMGDVVLGNLLHDKGLLSEEHYLQDLRPDAFVIAADDEAAKHLPRIVADLRKQNFHVRHSYKTTRNVGKLLGDASKSRARNAVILGKELAENPPGIVIKNLQSGEQKELPLSSLPEELRIVQQQR
jgi:histidyl-tRNA synthetase